MFVWFCLVVLIITGAFLFAAFTHLKNQETADIKNDVREVEWVFNNTLRAEATGMEIALRALVDRHDLLTFFASDDREGLQSAAEPIFEFFAENHGITHFSFLNSKGEIFLRVHGPDHFGDGHVRYTVRKAAELNQSYWAFEVGKFGAVTLRTAMPWPDYKGRIGFIELGKDIGPILDKIEETLDVRMVLALKQAFVADSTSVSGADEASGREMRKGSLPGHILLARDFDKLPKEAIGMLGDELDPSSERIEFLQESGRNYVASAIHLKGAGGDRKGLVQVIRDVTGTDTQFFRDQLLVLALVLLVVSVPSIFFYRVLGRAQHQINRGYGDLRKAVAARTAELGQTEQRLDEAQKIAGIGYWQLDLANGAFTWSDQVFEILEVDPSKDDISFEPFFASVHPDDRAAVEASYNAMPETAEEHSMTHRLMMPDGRVKWVQGHWKTLFSQAGKATQRRGTWQEITELKLAEEMNRRLALILEETINEVYVFDGDTFEFLQVNQSALKNLGYSADQFMQLKPSDIIREINDDELADLVRPLYEKDHQSLSVEATHVRENGSAYPIDLRLQYLDSIEPPVFFAVATDITERKNAESALRESEAQFRSAYENITEGLVIINGSGIVSEFNAAAESIFGYSREEMIGKNVSILMPEPDHGQHDGYLRNYLTTGERKIIALGREVVGLRKNGETFPMQLGVGEIQIEGRRSFVGSVRDLTKERNLERQLVQAQKMEAVGQLAGGIAHDFNNLLGIIIGNAEMIEDEIADDANLSVLISTLIKGANRGASLTERLLAFSRNQPLISKPTDIRDVLDSLVELLKRTLGEATELDIAGLDQDQLNSIAVVDAGQLEHALINLAVNARDAMPDGGKLSITCGWVDELPNDSDQDGAVASDGYVTITVSDTGHGIAEHHLERVFDPFFTTKDVGRGNSGLGLSMVYGFVKQSGGHIQIDSNLNVSTTVKIFLPAAGRPVPPDGIGSSETTATTAGDGRILVVEDDPDYRRTAATILRNAGYDVVVAETGAQATEFLQMEVNFDLIFSDIVLPGGMTGEEVARQARKMNPAIKILLTTGYFDGPIPEGDRSVGGAPLLRKPYGRSSLLESVRTILDRVDVD